MRWMVACAPFPFFTFLNSLSKMKVTRPIFPTPAKSFTTARLLIRPMTVDDAVEFHILRTQPEVMIFTSSGKIDVELDAPNDSTTFCFAIEQLETPGVIIGSVGSHLSEPPTMGYASTPDREPASMIKLCIKTTFHAVLAPS
jgi:RimJ/RimL family protein N-acetyltransferase